MKLEHFGMAEPGDCRLVFTAGAEELAAAVAQVQAEPDAPQEEDGLLTEAVNRTILGGFSALYEQLVQEYHVVPVTDPDFELLAVNRAEGFRAGAQFYALPPLEVGAYTGFVQPIEPHPIRQLPLNWRSTVTTATKNVQPMQQARRRCGSRWPARSGHSAVHRRCSGHARSWYGSWAMQ